MQVGQFTETGLLLAAWLDTGLGLASAQMWHPTVREWSWITASFFIDYLHQFLSLRHFLLRHQTHMKNCVIECIRYSVVWGQPRCQEEQWSGHSAITINGNLVQTGSSFLQSWQQTFANFHSAWRRPLLPSPCWERHKRTLLRHKANLAPKLWK